MGNEKTFSLDKLPAELRQMILTHVTTNIKVDSTAAYDLASLPTEHAAKWEWLHKTKRYVLSGKNGAEYAKFQALYAVSSTIRADMEIVEKQWLRSCPLNLAGLERWLDDPNRDRRETLVLAINPEDFFEKPLGAYMELAKVQKEIVLSRSTGGTACPGWTPYYLRWKEAIRRLPKRAFTRIIMCELEEPVPRPNNPHVPCKYRPMPQGPQQMLEGLLLIRTRSWKKEAVVAVHRKRPHPRSTQSQWP